MATIVLCVQLPSRADYRVVQRYKSVASALQLPLAISVYVPIFRRLRRYQDAAEKQMEYGFANKRRAGWNGTAGEKAINPAGQQGQTGAGGSR